tara:strand:+ start:13791 stop:14279 length:489 start_codon:yes stop_codon:yes gene_type:complete
MQTSDITVAGFSDPRRFLPEDESVADYGQLLESYVANLAPADALERRQVELILRCDLDVDRQHRMIRERLRPDASPAQKSVDMISGLRALHRDAVAQGESAKSAKVRQGQVQVDSARTTAKISEAYASNRLSIELHQRELQQSSRRRCQEINLLFKMQDRRR